MSPVLIGRDHPAGVLRAEIVRAAESHGGLVLVTGEAGIGKTVLVTDGADEARRRGALVLGGSCWDSDSAPGYWPWVQVVRGLRRGIGEEEWAEAERAAGGRLGMLLGEDPGPVREAAEGFPLYDAVTTALVTASQRRPVAVVLEDLHWADPASLRLLEFAAQHAWFERLLLIGTYRDVEVEAADHPLQKLILPLAARAAATVTLTGLGRDEVGALMALTGGVEPEPALVDEVHRHTGGNPFFVEQTVRAWRGGSPVTTVAPGVREAVRQRLALLPDEVSRLLETAAVLGHAFHRQVLAATAAVPVPHADRLMERAVAARLVTVEPDGRFAFAHDLVRETLYGELDEARRRRLHAAVVRALDGAPALSEKTHSADLAGHAYLAGEEVERDQRVDLLTAAARHAAGRLASEEAEGHYRRAMETAGDDRRRIALISLELGSVFWQRDAAEEARASFDHAVELAHGLRDPTLLARVAITLHQYGLTHDEDTRNSTLLRDAHRALIGSAGEDPTDLSSERIAQDLAVRTTALARSGADDDALAFSLWARHDTIWGLGTSEERLALTEEVITVARRSGNTDLELHAGSMRWVTLLELGDPRFRDQLRTFGRLAERSGLRRHELAKSVDNSLVATLSGRFDEGTELLSQVTDLGLGQAPYHYVASHMRWAQLMLQGRFAEAREQVKEAHPYPELLAGVTAAETGDTALALLHADGIAALREPLPRAFQPLALRMRAQAAAVSGDRARIEEARAALAPYRGQWVVSLWGCDISGPVDLWLGLLDAARGDREAAVAELTAARESADRLRARPWSVRARAALLELLGPEARATAAGAAGGRGLAEGVRRDAEELGLTHLLPAPAAGAEGPARSRPDAGGGSRGGAGHGGGFPGRSGHGGGFLDRTGHGGAAGAPQAALSGGAPGAEGPGREKETSRPRFRREGAVWELSFDGLSVHVPDAKGLRDLHTLLAHPGDDLAAVSLLAPEAGAVVIAARGLGGDPVLDDEAKLRYRLRLERLDEEIDRAAVLGDTRRAEEFTRERAALLDELRTAAGLGGRTRRLGDEAERARKTVTARIRDSLRKLAKLHPPLAAHLRESVTTGAHCSYRPPKPVEWRL
ncbi:AAA family ATPase [Streptomyces sp. NPDC001985]|uniref:ATP-binding protein n=1 Tax=Streptomyces sp. NPDC001985 TaxID=3154406 RepID=UPI003318B643